MKRDRCSRRLGARLQREHSLAGRLLDKKCPNTCAPRSGIMVFVRPGSANILAPAQLRLSAVGGYGRVL